MTGPDLSVIMPARDTAEFVGAAVQSVLDGAEGLLELIVIDNGSLDETGEIAASFGEPVRVVVKPRGGGPSFARNAGLELARGRLIGFLDSDDLWIAPRPDPRRVALDADSAVDGAMGRFQSFAAAPDGSLRDVIDPYYASAMGAGVFRRELFDRVGPFDPAFDNAEDFDWYARARHAGARLITVEGVVVRYRLRHGSITRDRASAQSAFLRSVRRAVEQRRGLGG